MLKKEATSLLSSRDNSTLMVSRVFFLLARSTNGVLNPYFTHVNGKYHKSKQHVKKLLGKTPKKKRV